VFDLSPFKLVVLAVIALIVFGPYELPKIAQQVGRALRDLRRIAEGAQADLREGLGPEFQDFDLQDLNPRRFVQKHLMDDINAAAKPVYDEYNSVMTSNGAASNGTGAGANGTRPTLLEGAEPPFDMEAT
jgi:sec-independent protein translocase protein TatB